MVSLTYPSTTRAGKYSGQKKEGSEGPYTSEEAKFTRERCIRVAAIVIMIAPGVSNICGVDKNEKSTVSPWRWQRNIRREMDLIFGAELSP
jgi:hypothetical protein